jgi:hypothetical protein
MADDEVGLPPEYDWTQSHSLGLRIVAFLCISFPVPCETIQERAEALP